MCSSIRRIKLTGIHIHETYFYILNVDSNPIKMFNSKTIAQKQDKGHPHYLLLLIIFFGNIS